MMLDIRYFCIDDTPSERCRTPVTTLPPELALLLDKWRIGGVILFSENLVSAAQIQTLTQQLQAAVSTPLFIATDQEGGRVARLPLDYFPAFGGAMALGAVPRAQRRDLAFAIAQQTGVALRGVGINVNFAPTVDVNSNAANPVINVRAFADDPEVVAALGAATVDGLQQHGVMAVLKHFPGHGDTYVDSHAGLPRVGHTIDQIKQVDMLPFAKIIASHAPAMVMTAHIQYPALDSTTLVQRNSKTGAITGNAIIKPATLSRTILHKVLRDELGFSGLIVTDALDMAGITQFFDPVTAVIETWRAGSDIALMPFTIRNASDIARFDKFMQKVVSQSAALPRTELAKSLERIAQTKDMWLEQDKRQVNTNTLYQSAQVNAYKLAEQSITVLKQKNKDVSEKFKTAQRLALVMPDALRCKGFETALNTIRPTLVSTCISLAVSRSSSDILKEVQDAQPDVVIIGELSPAQSVVEMGGMEDWSALRRAGQTRMDIAQQHSVIKVLLAQPQLAEQTVLVGLRAPYALPVLGEHAAAVYATYDYRVGPRDFSSPTLTVLVEHLFQGRQVYGRLPVKMDTVDTVPSAQHKH